MKSKRHLSTLDFLRGIAALFVVLFHYTGNGLPKIAIKEAGQLFSWGYLGVEMFFVISGFIIPYVLRKGNYTLSNFGNFIAKRFVRICPPSYIIIVFTIAQFFLIDRLNLSRNTWFGLLTVPQVIHNFTYTIPFTNYKWLNDVYWTLAVEFQFYIMIGLLFTFMFKNVKQFILCSVLLASLFYTPLVVPVQFFATSTLFIMGGFTFLHFEKRLATPHYILFLFLTGIACFLQAGMAPALFGVATSLIISYAQIKNRVSTFLGNISYSLYLTHILVGSTLEGIFIKILPPETLHIRLVLLLTILLAAIFGAYLFSRFIERFFINIAQTIFTEKEPAVHSLSQKESLVKTPL